MEQVVRVQQTLVVAVEEQEPDSYFLGYEAFEGLWEAAKVTRRERGEGFRRGQRFSRRWGNRQGRGT